MDLDGTSERWGRQPVLSKSFISANGKSDIKVGGRHMGLPLQAARIEYTPGSGFSILSDTARSKEGLQIS